MRENLLVRLKPINKIFSVTFQIILILISGVFIFLFGMLVLPVFITFLAQSTVMVDEKIFWYISRGSGILSFVFLWVSMLIGLLMTNRIIPRGYSTQIANELHKFVSLLGLAFILLHAFILIGDQYLQPVLWQILIPFTVFSYQPLSVGAGQISLYLWLVLVYSFNFRKHIGHRTWRIIHYLSFPAFWLVVVHGVVSGTDTSSPLMQVLYWASAISILFLSVYRVLGAIFQVSGKLDAHQAEPH